MKYKTWSDNVCGDMIRMIMPIAGGLDACKELCDKEKSCTAIEYSSIIHCCVLRKCPVPVPEPQVTDATWHDGIAKYVGYVKLKPTGPQHKSNPTPPDVLT